MSDIMSMRETIDILIRLKKQKTHSEESPSNNLATLAGDGEQNDQPLANTSDCNGQISDTTNEHISHRQFSAAEPGINIFSDEIDEVWEKEKEEIDKFDQNKPPGNLSTKKRKSDFDNQSTTENKDKPLQCPKPWSHWIFSKKVQNHRKQENNISVTETGAVEVEKPVYCICQQESYGDMVACDNQDCAFEWFHFSCVGVTKPPGDVWICPPCKKDNCTKKKMHKK